LTTTSADAKLKISAGSIVTFKSAGKSSLQGPLDSAGTIDVESELSLAGAVKSTKLFQPKKGAKVEISSTAGTVAFEGEGLKNAGTLTLGAVKVTADNYEQSDGETSCDGTTITMKAGTPMKLSGGSVTGPAGTITGDIALSGSASLIPGATTSRRRLAGAVTFGVLNVIGDVNFGAAQETKIDIDPATSSKDEIKVVGSITLGGVLALNIPACGASDSETTHTIISATKIIGDFASITGDTGVTVSVTPTAVTVTHCPAGAGTGATPPATPATPATPKTPAPTPDTMSGASCTTSSVFVSVLCLLVVAMSQI